MRRHPAFENGEPQCALIGGKALLLRSLKRIRDGSRSREIVAVAMTMSVTMPPGVMQFAQRAQRDPAAETDKRDTGCSIDEVAKPRREADSGDPHNHADQQSRHDVA